jgi:hypothetical protein
VNENQKKESEVIPCAFSFSNKININNATRISTAIRTDFANARKKYTFPRNKYDLAISGKVSLKHTHTYRIGV